MATNDEIKSGNEELDKKISQWLDWDKVSRNSISAFRVIAIVM